MAKICEFNSDYAIDVLTTLDVKVMLYKNEGRKTPAHDALLDTLLAACKNYDESLKNNPSWSAETFFAELLEALAKESQSFKQLLDIKAFGVSPALDLAKLVEKHDAPAPDTNTQTLPSTEDTGSTGKERKAQRAKNLDFLAHAFLGFDNIQLSLKEDSLYDLTSVCNYGYDKTSARPTEVVRNNIQLNKNIAIYQQRLWAEVRRGLLASRLIEDASLLPEYMWETLDGQIAFDYDGMPTYLGTVNNCYDIICKALTGNEASLFADNDTINHYQANNQDALDAYKAWQLLMHFDSMTLMHYGDSITCNRIQDGSFSNKKYAFGDKSSSNIRDWNSEGKEDAESLMDPGLKNFIVTRPLVKDGTTLDASTFNKFGRPNEYLQMHNVKAAVSAIRKIFTERMYGPNFANKYGILSEVQQLLQQKNVWDSLDSDTQRFFEQNSSMTIPQIYAEARTSAHSNWRVIYDLFGNKNVRDVLATAYNIRTGELKANVRDVLNTINQTMLNTDKSARYNIMLSNEAGQKSLPIYNDKNKSNSNIVTNILQAFDTMTSVNMVQYFLDHNGEIFTSKMRSMSEVAERARILGEMLAMNEASVYTKFKARYNPQRSTSADTNTISYIIPAGGAAIKIVHAKNDPEGEIKAYFGKKAKDGYEFESKSFNIIAASTWSKESALRKFALMNPGVETALLRFFADTLKTEFRDFKDLESFNKEYNMQSLVVFTAADHVVQGLVIQQDFVRPEYGADAKPGSYNHAAKLYFHKTEKSNAKHTTLTYDEDAKGFNLSLINSSLMFALASKRAIQFGRLKDTVVNSAEHKKFASVVTSRLLGNLTTQFNSRSLNLAEDSAIKNFSLYNMFVNTYQVQELYINGQVKAATDFNAAEFAYGQFLFDYVAGLADNSDLNALVGNNKIALLPSINSDKGVIGRLLVDLSKVDPNTKKKYASFTTQDWEAAIAREIGGYYRGVAYNIGLDMFNMLSWHAERTSNIAAQEQLQQFAESTNKKYEYLVLDNYKLVNTILSSFKEEFASSKNTQVLNTINKSYNLEHPGKPIEIISQISYMDNGGNLAWNNAIVGNIYRFSDQTLQQYIDKAVQDANGVILHDYQKADEYWDFQSAEVLKSLIDANFQVDTSLNPHQYTAMTKLKELCADGWIDSTSQKMILAKITLDGQTYNLSTKRQFEELMESERVTTTILEHLKLKMIAIRGVEQGLADYQIMVNAPSIDDTELVGMLTQYKEGTPASAKLARDIYVFTRHLLDAKDVSASDCIQLIRDAFNADMSNKQLILNPVLDKYNKIDYFVTQEFMLATVGTHAAHPAKLKKQKHLKDYSTLTEEAQRFLAQLKRNVAMTATMHQFLLDDLSGIQRHYKVSVLEELSDVQYNVNGDINNGVSIHDGSMFVNPFFSYLENNSLGSARAGGNKKQFIHSMNSRYGAAKLDKCAGFALDNRTLRMSPSIKINGQIVSLYGHIMKMMTSLKWHGETDAEGKISNDEGFDITKNFLGESIADELVKDTYFQYDKKFVQLTGIEKAEGKNQYKISGKFLSGDVSANRFGGELKGGETPLSDIEMSEVLRSKGLETSDGIVTIDNNYSLWQLFGGEASLQREGLTKLVPSENSIKNVVFAMNNTGTLRKGVDSNTTIESQKQVWQFMKRADIAYAISETAMKNGITNKSKITDDSWNFFLLDMYNAGIQLDKEHHADDSDMALMSQVISAAAHAGFTEDSAWLLYMSLATMSMANIRQILSPFEKFMNSSFDPALAKVFRDSCLKAVANALSKGDAAHFVSNACHGVIEDIRNGYLSLAFINEFSTKVPIDDPTIRAGFVKELASFFKKKGIKMRWDGVLAVLNPSQNIVKTFDGEMYTNVQAKARQKYEGVSVTAELQAQYLERYGLTFEENAVVSAEQAEYMYLTDMLIDKDHNPLLNRTGHITGESKTTLGKTKGVDDWGSIKVSRHYKILRKGSSETEVVHLRTPLDRMKLVQDIRNQDVTFVSEYVALGEDLQNYDCFFVATDGIDTAGFSVFDTDALMLLFRAKQLSNDTSDLESFSKEATTLIKKYKAEWQGYARTHKQYYQKTKMLQYVNLAAKIEQYSAKDLLENLNEVKKVLAFIKEQEALAISPTGKKFSPKDTVYIGGKSFTVDSEKTTTLAAGLVMPKTFASRFGLSVHDSLKEILDNENFFGDRLYNNLKSRTVAENAYDVALLSGNGKHVYIKISKDAKLPGFERVQMPTAVEDNKTFIIEPSGDLGMEINASDTFWTNSVGETVIMVQSLKDLETYLATLEYIAVDMSSLASPAMLDIDLSSVKVYKDSLGDIVMKDRQPLTSEAIDDGYKIEANTDGTITITRPAGKKWAYSTESIIVKEAAAEDVAALKAKKQTALKKFLSLKKHRKAADIPEMVEAAEFFNSLLGDSENLLKDFCKEIGAQQMTSFQLALRPVVSRTPSQSMQSYMAMEVVGFNEEDSNNIYVSAMQIWLQGSDYDIDAASVAHYSIGKDGLLSTHSPYISLANTELAKQGISKIDLPTGKSAFISSFENLKNPDSKSSVYITSNSDFSKYNTHSFYRITAKDLLETCAAYAKEHSDLNVPHIKTHMEIYDNKNFSLYAEMQNKVFANAAMAEAFYRIISCSSKMNITDKLAMLEVLKDFWDINDHIIKASEGCYPNGAEKLKELSKDKPEFYQELHRFLSERLQERLGSDYTDTIANSFAVGDYTAKNQNVSNFHKLYLTTRLKKHEKQFALIWADLVDSDVQAPLDSNDIADEVRIFLSSKYFKDIIKDKGLGWREFNAELWEEACQNFWQDTYYLFLRAKSAVEKDGGPSTILDIKNIATLIHKMNAEDSIPVPLDDITIENKATKGTKTLSAEEILKEAEELKKFLDRHNNFLIKKGARYANSALQNKQILELYTPIADYINQMLALQPVDQTTGAPKSLAAKSKIAFNQLNKGIGNFANKGEGIVENQVGKICIAMAANGLKGFFAISEHYNRLMAEGKKVETLGSGGKGIDIFLPNTGESRTFKYWANIRTTLEQALQNPNLAEVEALSAQIGDTDAAICLSALLSLATDNAKELCLSKINATVKTIDLYIFGLSIGMTFEDIASIMQSPVCDILMQTMNTRNSFYQKDALGRLQDTFHYFQQGPIAMISDIVGLDRYVKLNTSNVAVDSDGIVRKFFDVFIRDIPTEGYTNIKGTETVKVSQYDMANLLASFAWTEVLWDSALNKGVPMDPMDPAKGPFIKQKKAILLELFAKCALDATISKMPGYEIVLALLQESIFEYLELVELIKANFKTYQSIQTLAQGASEMALLNQVLKLNLGMGVSLAEQIQLNTTLTSLCSRALGQRQFYHKLAEATKLKLKNGEYAKAKERATSFNIKPLDRKVPEYEAHDLFNSRSKNIQSAYDAVKFAFNIPAIVTHLPHFRIYAEQGAMCSEGIIINSKLASTLNNVSNKLTRMYGVHDANIIKDIYRGFERFYDRYVLNTFYLISHDSLPKFKTSQGVFLQSYNHSPKLNKEGEIQEFVLGTSAGNATFKRWFEQEVFPAMQEAFADNAFVKDLIPQSIRSERQNKVRALTLPVDMMGLEPAAIANVARYREAFSKLSRKLITVSSTGMTYNVRDLLTIYALVVWNNRKSRESWVPFLSEFLRDPDSLYSKFTQHLHEFSQKLSFEQGKDFYLTDLHEYCAPVCKSLSAARAKNYNIFWVADRDGVMHLLRKEKVSNEVMEAAAEAFKKQQDAAKDSAMAYMEDNFTYGSYEEMMAQVDIDYDADAAGIAYEYEAYNEGYYDYDDIIDFGNIADSMSSKKREPWKVPNGYEELQTANKFASSEAQNAYVTPLKNVGILSISNTSENLVDGRFLVTVSFNTNSINATQDSTKAMSLEAHDAVTAGKYHELHELIKNHRTALSEAIVEVNNLRAFGGASYITATNKLTAIIKGSEDICLFLTKISEADIESYALYSANKEETVHNIKEAHAWLLEAFSENGLWSKYASLDKNGIPANTHSKAKDPTSLQSNIAAFLAEVYEKANILLPHDIIIINNPGIDIPILATLARGKLAKMTYDNDAVLKSAETKLRLEFHKC